MNNLQLNIAHYILDDDAPRATQGAILAKLYHTANQEGQELLNNAFIALCGFSLRHLLTECDWGLNND
jgi:hypothetical protein